MAILDHKRHRWLLIIWAIVGLVVSWERTYITVHIIQTLVTVVLAVFLWPLVLLGVNLHVH